MSSELEIYKVKVMQGQETLKDELTRKYKQIDMKRLR